MVHFGELHFYNHDHLDCSRFVDYDNPGPCVAIGTPDLIVKPRKGRMIVFGSGRENPHRVTRVKEGVTESGTEQTVDGTLPPDYGSYVMSRQNDQNSRCGGTLDSNQQGVCSEGVHQIQTILSEANSLLKFSRQRSWFWNISWFGWFGFGCCWCIGTRIFNQIVDDI